MANRFSHNERGVAIMLVLFVVVLTTALVTSLARSTYLGGRVNASIEKGLRAEYLVKSALAVAQILIKEDKTPNDMKSAPWYFYRDGKEKIPVELFGIDEPNIYVQLEISPLEARFPLAALKSSTTPDIKWLHALERLFRALHFDTDGEVDLSGAFKGQTFTTEDLVANFMDYIDADNNENFDLPPFRGIEAAAPADAFPNRMPANELELQNIPGFTPARVRKLLPYIRLDSGNIVNINAASPLVMSTLHDDLFFNDWALAKDIYNKREDPAHGPFSSTADLLPLMTSDTYNAISNMVAPSGTKFQVIAKADFVVVATYLRAILTRGSTGDLPKIDAVQIY